MKKQPTTPKKSKRSPAGFDPFNNRLSRDIRNTLSEAFVDAVERKKSSGYRIVAENWLAGKPDEIYASYIRDRLHRYDHVLEQITENRLDDALLQSLVIWNNGLFFEFHDHVERIWQQTKGDEHQALKGLIKAAGVYIHMEHDHHQAVKGLSTKSLDLLRRYCHCLMFVSNLKELMQSLESMDPVSPKLENPAIRQD